MPPALIDNGQITCPYCEHIVDVKQQRIGATYTKSWETVPPNCMNILTWWINTYPSHALTKQQLLATYGKHHNVSTQPFSARISELFGLGFIEHDREIMVNSTHTKQKTIQSPRYNLNLKKVRQIIRLKGKLKL